MSRTNTHNTEEFTLDQIIQLAYDIPVKRKPKEIPCGLLQNWEYELEDESDISIWELSGHDEIIEFEEVDDT